MYITRVLAPTHRGGTGMPTHAHTPPNTIKHLLPLYFDSAGHSGARVKPEAAPRANATPERVSEGLASVQASDT